MFWFPKFKSGEQKNVLRIFGGWYVYFFFVLCWIFVISLCAALRVIKRVASASMCFRWLSMVVVGTLLRRFTKLTQFLLSINCLLYFTFFSTVDLSIGKNLGKNIFFRKPQMGKLYVWQYINV